MDIEAYRRDGFTVVEGVFAADKCEAFVAYMMDLQAGRRVLEGFAARAADEWGRTHNQHWYDPVAHQWLTDPELKEPLRQCLRDTPEGIQTMYF